MSGCARAGVGTGAVPANVGVRPMEAGQLCAHTPGRWRAAERETQQVRSATRAGQGPGPQRRRPHAEDIPRSRWPARGRRPSSMGTRGASAAVGCADLGLGPPTTCLLPRPRPCGAAGARLAPPGGTRASSWGTLGKARSPHTTRPLAPTARARRRPGAPSAPAGATYVLAPRGDVGERARAVGGLVRRRLQAILGVRHRGAREGKGGVRGVEGECVRSSVVVRAGGAAPRPPRAVWRGATAKQRNCARIRTAPESSCAL